MAGCPVGVGPSQATNIVSEGWERWKADAERISQLAINYLDDIKNLNINPVDTNAINAELDDIAKPATFVRPNAPSASEYDVQTSTVPAAPEVNFVDPSVGSAPNFTTSAPEYVYATFPNFDTVKPTIDTDIADIAIPDAPTIVDPTAPTYTLPDAPSIYKIELPPVPDITLPTFDEVLPVGGIDIPEFDITFSEPGYSSTLLTDIQAKVTAWLAGGTGLPDAIWNALWNRASENEEQLGARAVVEATEEFASRGYSMMSGVLDRKLRDTRREVRTKLASLNRETAIKQADMEVENIRFAVQQGIALETLTADLYNQSQARLLSLQELLLNYYLGLYDLQIKNYNARLLGYQTEAEVYKSNIQAELARLEIYKSQIEGEKLKLEASGLEVDVYTAQLEAITKQIQIYNSEIQALISKVNLYQAEVDARKTLLESEAQRLDAEKLKLDVYRTDVEVYKTEVDAASTRDEQNRIKADVYNSSVNAFASRVSAFKSEADVEIASSEAKNQVNDFNLRAYQSKLEAIRTELQSEQIRIDSLAKSFASEVQAFQADSTTERDYTAASIERYRAEVAAAQAEAQLAAEKARLDVEQALRITQLESDNARGAAEAYAQLSAATVSGVNLSSGIQAADYNNTGCTETYSFQGN